MILEAGKNLRTNIKGEILWLLLQDQKYLNPQGVAALQQATDAWAKANAAGDTAGMLAARNRRSIRVGNQYLNQPGTGYTTHGWYLLGPVAAPCCVCCNPTICGTSHKSGNMTPV